MQLGHAVTRIEPCAAEKPDWRRSYRDFEPEHAEFPVEMMERRRIALQVFRKQAPRFTKGSRLERFMRSLRNSGSMALCESRNCG